MDASVVAPTFPSTEDRSMFRRLALAGLALLLTAAPALPQSITDSRLPTRIAAARLGLERQWYTTVPLGNGHERVLMFNVDGGMLFVQTSGGNLFAYDAESGRALWNANLGPAAAQAFDVSVGTDQVITTNLKTLFGLDRETGRIRWQASLEDLPSTSTGVGDGQAMVGLRSGKIQAFTTREIERKKGIPRLPGGFLWAWQTGAELSARPITTPKVTTFGSQDHRVYTATNGDVETKPLLLYRFLTGGPISANMAIWGNRTLIVPSGDNEVYAIDLFDGTFRWSVATGAPIDQEPLVSGAEVYVTNASGRVIRIDGTNGEVVWDQHVGGEKLLALSPSRLYLETQDHDLMIMDRATGQLLAGPRETLQRAGLDLRGFSLSFANYYDDRLYFCTPGGLLVCLREIGRTRPTTLRDPSLPPFGTIPPGGLMTDTDSPDAREVAAPPRGEEPAEPGAEGEVPEPGFGPDGGF
jgi:outer membrane protein assembly factor BamB